MSVSAGSRSSHGRAGDRGDVPPAALSIFALRAVLPAACLLAAMTLLSGCQAAAPHAIRTLPGDPAALEIRTSRGAEAVRPLVAEVWDSGFFKNNEIVRGEITNNDYALFGRESALAATNRSGLACFSRARGRRDAILFRADFVRYVKTTEVGLSEPAYPRKKILEVLVHELCHDLWDNVLDERERAMFAMEGEDFLADFGQAKTDEGKRLFLRKAGESDRAPADMRSFAGLDALIRLYPPERRFGAELFAWFGEQAFTGKGRIPAPFRKYFSGLFTDLGPGPSEDPR